jgi:predicted GIY-YIG superfamily endonuclease
VGHTDNIEKRIAEHKSGIFSCYTSQRLPIKLMYSEIFSTRIDALAAERKLKKWTRRKKEIVINEGWAALSGWKHKK